MVDIWFKNIFVYNETQEVKKVNEWQPEKVKEEGFKAKIKSLNALGEMKIMFDEVMEVKGSLSHYNSSNIDIYVEPS